MFQRVSVFHAKYSFVCVFYYMLSPSFIDECLLDFHFGCCIGPDVNMHAHTTPLSFFSLLGTCTLKSVIVGF